MKALPEAYRSTSSSLLGEYQPLVHLFVLNPEGDIVSQKRMNEDIMDIYEEAWRPNEEVQQFFLDYLEKSRREALEES